MVESSSRGVIFGGCGVGGVNGREGLDCCDVVFDDPVGCGIVGSGGGRFVADVVVALDVVVLSSTACMTRPWPSGVGC